MLRRITLIALTLASILFSYEKPALATCNGFAYNPQPFAYESLTVSTVAVIFTVATYAPGTGSGPAAYAYATVETNPIRYRADGTAPTSSEGHLVTASQAFEVCGVGAVKQFQMIRQGAADATVKITYFR